MAVVRDVVIRFSADDKDLRRASATLDSVNQKVNQTGKQWSDASKKMQASTKDTTQNFSAMGNALNSLGRQIAVAFSVGAIIAFARESVRAFRDAEQAANKLSFAVKNLANGSSGDVDTLIKQSKELQSVGIFSSGMIQSAQTALLTIGLTTEEVGRLIPAFVEAAAATGDFDGTLQKVIAGINGSDDKLKKLGINLSDVEGKTARTAEITDKLTKFQGSMASAMETSAGQAANLDGRIENLQETLGEKLAPALGGVQEALLDTALAFINAWTEAGRLDEFLRQLGSNDEVKTFYKDLAAQFDGVAGITHDAFMSARIEFEALQGMRAKMNNTEFLQQLKMDYDFLKKQKDEGKLTVEQFVLMGKAYEHFLKTIKAPAPTTDTGAGDEGPINTIEKIKARIKELKEWQEKEVIGSVTFLRIGEEIMRLEKEIATDTVKTVGKTYEELMDLKKSQLRQIRDLEASSFEEGIERDRAMLKVKFDNELEDVEGYTETANQLRSALTEKYFLDLADLEEKEKERKAKEREKQADEDQKRRDKDFEQDEKDLQDGLDLQKKYAEKLLAYNEEVANAENDLMQAKMDALQAFGQAGQNIFADNAQLAKVFFLFQKAVAVGDIFRNLAIEISGYSSNPVWTAMPDGGATLKSAAIAKAKIRAGIGVGTILAQVIPELAGFKEGVIDLRGPGTKTSDSIPARLSKGESVMTADETEKHKGLFQAIRDKDFDRYLNERFILPKLNMALGHKWLGSGSNNSQTIVNPMDEKKFARAMRGNTVNVNNIDDLAKAMNKNARKEAMFKRRGVS